MAGATFLQELPQVTRYLGAWGLKSRKPIWHMVNFQKIKVLRRGTVDGQAATKGYLGKFKRIQPGRYGLRVRGVEIWLAHPTP